MSRSPLAVLVLVTLALFTDLLIYNMVVPFLPEHVVGNEGSALAVNVVFAAYPFGLLLALPLAARWCDRFRRRAAMLAGLAGLGAATLLYLCATSFAALLAARLLQGAAGAVVWTVGLALVADAFPAKERGWAMGWAMSGLSVGALVGPPIGGLLYAWGGYSLPFLCAAGWTAVQAVVIAFALPELPRRHDAAQKPAEPVRRGRGRSQLVTLGVIVVGGTVLSLLEPTLPLDLSDRLQMDAASIGLMFGCATVAYAVVSPLAGWVSDRYGHRRTMAWGLAGLAVTLPLIAWPGSWWLEIIALAPFGAACAFVLAPTLSDLANLADEGGDSGYGSAYARSNVAYAVGMFVGPMLGGSLVSVLGFAGTLVLFGVASLAYVPVLIAARRPPAVATSEEASLAA